MGDLFSTILWVSAVVIAISGATRIVTYLKTISTQGTQISNQLSHIELKLGQLDHLEKLDLFDQRGDHLEKLDLLDQRGEIVNQLASIEKRVGEVVSQLEVYQPLLLEQLQSIERQLELLEKANAPDDDDWPVRD
jgi:septation ring formation regulator EzrA